jgi:RNA polymerase sigma factor (sigma-70 family)
MGVSIRSGLIGFITRLGRAPVADSNADLLERFVSTADEEAFTGIVRRHGPMVLAVCRRRLGREADAEDAFQAVFLALARSASSIGHRESLPGWLYRAAYLVSLKAAGRRARHPLAALAAAEAPMPNPPTSAMEAAELREAIDAELAALPDRFRSVVVLCLIEGRTNSEAAASLGVPVGTVDSRLNTARARLRARLTRRGVASVAGVTVEQSYGGSVMAAESVLFENLVSSTVRAVLAEVAGLGAGAVSPAVADLARGVTTMTTMKLRILAALGIALGLVGGAGAGIYLAAADKPAQSVAKLDDAVTEPMPSQPTEPQEKKGTLQADAKGTAASLDQALGLKIQGELPLAELLERIEEMTGLVVRVDVAAFRRVGAFDEQNVNTATRVIYETLASLPRKVDKLPIRDVLTDALAQVKLEHPVTYQVRGSQLVIVPAFVPPSRPGANLLDPFEDIVPNVDTRILHEQIYGGVVTVTADRKPLADILTDLRKQTGANIVLDPRCDAQEKKPGLTLTLNDVRLFDALRVIADMAELKMVYAGNIYYVTTPANAKSFQPPARPPAPEPPPGP